MSTSDSGRQWEAGSSDRPGVGRSSGRPVVLAAAAKWLGQRAVVVEFPPGVLTGSAGLARFDFGGEPLAPASLGGGLCGVPGFGAEPRVSAGSARRGCRGSAVSLAAIDGAWAVRVGVGGLVTFPCYVTLQWCW